MVLETATLDDDFVTDLLNQKDVRKTVEGACFPSLHYIFNIVTADMCGKSSLKIALEDKILIAWGLESRTLLHSLQFKLISQILCYPPQHVCHTNIKLQRLRRTRP